jgi:hypothetical protein
VGPGHKTVVSTNYLRVAARSAALNLGRNAFWQRCSSSPRCSSSTTAATLAVGGAFTAIVLGLAAQQTLGSLFAGVLISLVVVPLREPPKVDLRARFSHEASPRRIEEQLQVAIAALKPAYAQSG